MDLLLKYFIRIYYNLYKYIKLLIDNHKTHANIVRKSSKKKTVNFSNSKLIFKNKCIVENSITNKSSKIKF